MGLSKLVPFLLVFKSLCASTNILKNNLRILSCNPISIKIWNDPWITGIPIRSKPTYLNMDLSLDDMWFEDVVDAIGVN